jgi:hypothetical protein
MDEGLLGLVTGNGKDLPTSYTVSGNVVSQHIDTTGAAFPVVAYAQYGCGFGWCSAYFDKRETRDLSTGAVAAAGGATAACGISG